MPSREQGVQVGCLLVAPQAVQIGGPPIEGGGEGVSFQGLIGLQLLWMLLQPGDRQQRLEGIGRGETRQGLRWHTRTGIHGPGHQGGQRHTAEVHQAAAAGGALQLGQGCQERPIVLACTLGSQPPQGIGIDDQQRQLGAGLCRIGQRQHLQVGLHQAISKPGRIQPRCPDLDLHGNGPSNLPHCRRGRQSGANGMPLGAATGQNPRSGRGRQLLDAGPVQE